MDSYTLQIAYNSFVRLIMEYGHVVIIKWVPALHN